MSDKRNAPSTSEGARSGKNKVPTIDLTATEIRSEASESTSAKSDPQSNNDTSSSKKEHIKSDSIGSDMFYLRQLNRFTVAVLATAILGIVVGFVLTLWLWSKGAPQGGANADVNAQINRLQSQIANLHNRLAANNTPDIVESIANRVTKIESNLANLAKMSGGDVSRRLNGVDNDIKSLTGANDTLNKRENDIDTKIARIAEQADAMEKTVTQLRNSVQHIEQTTSATVDHDLIKNLQQHVDALERSVENSNNEIAKFATDEKAIRLALSAIMLRAAVMSGTPYQDELTQAKALSTDKKILTPLEPFAATGLVSQEALVGELRALIPAIKAAIRSTEVPAKGFIEQLWADFNKLVRITPLNSPANEGVSDILSRLEIALTRTDLQADISAALSELMKLPDSARAPAQTWIKKAQERQAAIAAAQSFAASSARHLRPE